MSRPRHRSDSRAIKGSRVKGRLVTTDLSDDHKPDLPLEKARIEAAGGEVTSGGANGSPARVWAGGRVGLAMSRSIGDFECKRYGVIPDPEVKRFDLSPATGPGADGDLFIVIASDGSTRSTSTRDAVEML